MNKKRIVYSLSLCMTAAAVVAVALTSNSGMLKFRKVAALEAPDEKISSVSFYENSEVADIYSQGTYVGDGRFADYRANQSVPLGGTNWIISAAAYGEDNPTAITQTAGYHTLHFDSVWDASIANTYSLFDATMTSEGIYKDYLDDYNSMIESSGWTYRMVFMSTTTFTDVKDFGFFWHYSTANYGTEESHSYGSSTMGVIPLIKLKGETTWATPWYNAVSYSGGSTYYEDNGSLLEGNAEFRYDQLGSGYAGRFYDGSFLYNDAHFNNFAGKEVYLGFLVYAVGAPYFMNMQFDGIIVNRHESAMKFMNSLDGQSVCGAQGITDKNINKCFELFDRAFDSSSSSGNDLDELEDYAIDHSKFPTLSENNYYDQYQFLKSKLA